MVFQIPFKLISKRFLGIDIGTSSIKIVELSRWGERKKLENYGEIGAEALFKKPFREIVEGILSISSQEVSRGIRAILEEAKIKTREVIFSIPDFSTFFTWFELPPMTKDELPQAVRYQARQYIPLPISEVTLDWQVIEGEVSDQRRTPLKILLVAVPNEVINQYKEIARLSQLELVALEAEVFGLLRSLVRERKIISVVDIGAQTTSCSIIERKILKRSHSFDLSGDDLTAAISRSLGIDYKEAEDLKLKEGIEIGPKGIREILLPLIDSILIEIEKISNSFYQREGKEVEKFILAGASAFLPGLKEYFSQKLKKEIEIGNPFSDLFYPPILEDTLKKMGPSYAIAVGMALRGLE